MKAVILAGGLGTRLAEETVTRPKPMVEIGGKPILWHIMKHYSYYGVNDFIICLGYKGYMIKEFFQNYLLHNVDVTFDFNTGRTHHHGTNIEPWKVTLVDTGEKTETGGRLRRISHLFGTETFCMTYGDGLSDINIHELIQYHRSHNRLATLTAVAPPGRFGALEIGVQKNVHRFVEKPKGDGGRINGGFFVLNSAVFHWLGGGDNIAWEDAPLKDLAKHDDLRAYEHDGFWKPMDTLREKQELEALWESGKAPWKIW